MARATRRGTRSPARWPAKRLVGEVGLEPTISCSQSTCVANYATPRRFHAQEPHMLPETGFLDFAYTAPIAGRLDHRMRHEMSWHRPRRDSSMIRRHRISTRSRQQGGVIGRPTADGASGGEDAHPPSSLSGRGAAMAIRADDVHPDREVVRCDPLLVREPAPSGDQSGHPRTPSEACSRIPRQPRASAPGRRGRRRLKDPRPTVVLVCECGK